MLIMEKGVEIPNIYLKQDKISRGHPRRSPETNTLAPPPPPGKKPFYSVIQGVAQWVTPPPPTLPKILSPPRSNEAMYSLSSKTKKDALSKPLLLRYRKKTRTLNFIFCKLT